MSIEQAIKRRMGKPKKRNAVDLNGMLWQQLGMLGVQERFVREFAFAPDRETRIFHKLKGGKWKWDVTDKRRGWRADFACVDRRLLIEVDGSTFHRGGHSSGAALENSYYRQAMAEITGWMMLRVTRRMIEETVAVELIARALQRS